MNRIQKFAVATATAAIAAFSASSQATIVSASSNNPLAFSWSFLTAPAGTTLDGEGSMTVSGFGTNSLVVSVYLKNNADLGGNGGERLTSFGFGIDPNANSVAFGDAADAGMIDASLKKIPSLALIEVCAWGGQNCSGGSNGGIYGAGGSDMFTLTLTTLSNGGIWGDSVNIDPIGFKYQTGYGSFEFTTGSSSSGGFPVPEPGTLTLLGLGLLGLGYSRRLSKAN